MIAELCHRYSPTSSEPTFMATSLTYVIEIQKSLVSLMLLLKLPGRASPIGISRVRNGIGGMRMGYGRGYGQG